MKEPIKPEAGKKAKPEPRKKAPDPKRSHLEEALRMIEQYANDLREIMARLRKRFH
jgi:hypothetical protein